jgi:16S rRNA (cytosine1402-N4)-methyltransferase
MESSLHIPVLFQESLDSLQIQDDQVYVDGTLGGAGHAYAIAAQLSPQGTFIGCDVDYDAITRAQDRLHNLSCKKYFVHDNFRTIATIVDRIGISQIHGVLLDLGWSSFQIADPSRGLSFAHDGPLDMNLAKGLAQDDQLTAYEIINHWEEATLADIFYAYGDETKARTIARHIVTKRKKQPIATTHELAETVIEAIFTKKRPTHFKIHPATKVFQALRIMVNDEYQTITEGVTQSFRLLAPGGRLAVITFHSGEDRIVKQLFKEFATNGQGVLVHKKPMSPSLSEIRANPRSRSAKLRVIEKC